MSDWHERIDWKHGSYFYENPDLFRARLKRGESFPQIDTDHMTDTFSMLGFSYAVSAVWDWDILNGPVRMSKRAALQAARAMRDVKLTDERYSLEALVHEGWEIPANWFRAGTTERPAWFLGAVPVATVLDDSVAEHGLAYLVTAEHPPERPAYVRVLWSEEATLIDPDAERLEAILADKESM